MSTIWVENVSQLFALNKGIFPSSGMSLSDNLNAITRLAFIACIILACFKPVLAVSTFIIVTVTVLALYYGSVPPKEGYEEPVAGLAGELFKHDTAFPPTRMRFCNDVRPIQYDEEYVSQNQMLVGGPNPKTLLPPIISQPSHNLSFWKASDLTTHSHVNASTNYDSSDAGYNAPTGYSGYARFSNVDRPKICTDCLLAPCRCQSGRPTRSEQLRTATLQPGVYERSDFLEPINSLIGISQQRQFQPTRITRINAPSGSTVLYDAESINKDPLPDVTCRDQNDSDQSNLQANSAQANSQTTEQNRPQQTTILQDTSLPAVAYKGRENVYDPRFTGYGPSNRHYVDPITGASKFFYKDIDAATMPNYICRSNIDVYPWAAQYGSGVNGSDMSGPPAPGDGYKQLAENAFLDSTIQFRTEMQERLMRKRNAEMWQRRVAPIYT